MKNFFSALIFGERGREREHLRSSRKRKERGVGRGKKTLYLLVAIHADFVTSIYRRFLRKKGTPNKTKTCLLVYIVQ